ncbi:uncharacterized protein F4822DRAFT_104838 [Hypoxylon trugodes]|uniref:uncharacterized protein n=1 Tax=Hypoxylon trugodes TaxID=326681 RepID=UPI00219F985A|nr:uncharacterized protein F4822DRAFT_104838 [Hypoxylon trugodes]KAI1391759.1 hypothetical protein F4822DRAFT_104838 [Hypoxylon trugodes]
MGLAPLTITAMPTALAVRATSLDHDGTPPVAALTTVWTASEGCFPVSTRSTTDIDLFWTSHTKCAPPGYASYFETYYYSPAICPSGFTIGCSRYGQGPPVESTETAVLCVMSDYSCAPDEWNYYATNTDLSYAQVMIQIRWAESDLSILETHPLTPGLILAGTSAVHSGTTRTESSSSATVTVISSDSEDGENGLSTGAQVGIGVGVGLLGLLGIGLAIFFILRYRRKRADGSGAVGQSPAMPQPSAHQYPPMSGPGQQGQGYPQSPYSGYASYIDPKTGAVVYYSPVPQPTELGDTAVRGSHLTQSQGTPSVVGFVRLQDPTFSGKSPSSQASPGVDFSATIPPGGHNSVTSAPTAAEMSGTAGISRSVAGTESSQTQQEMAYLIAEQAKLEARRTRLMELAELDEEEQRLRTRMQQIQQIQ